MTTSEGVSAPLVYLDDYLASRDFPGNLSALSNPLGAELGMPSRVDELGIVCADVPALAYALERRYRNMGPFFMGHGSPAEFREDGKLVQYETRVAFGYYRGVLLELAEPGHGSDLFARAYDPERATIHHLGFYARDEALHRDEGDGYVDFRERFAAQGLEPHIRALVAVLGFFGRVTIFDTARATSGVDLEFLDFRAFGRNGLKIGLPEWLVGLGARLQRLVGHPVLELPSKSG
ncbi:MAG TPA: hypothetical protein VGQ57_20665 [Polyangiaceae bacterium]|jgi:hypothetical protein|nr:hypothetical protein [Polyangiaceae bacterium]